MGKENKDSVKMDPVLKLIKVFHSIVGTTEADLKEHLEKQRVAQEKLSMLSAPNHGLERKSLEVQQIPCEWTVPEFPHEDKKVILYCHGGGYTCGGLGYARILAGKMALSIGYPVLSFEYRLAPEHPFPAAIEDAMQVWDYLMLQGYGSHQVILAGDSAGGNLALELALRLKAQMRFLPAGLLLMSPWTDMTMNAKSYELYGESDPILTAEYISHVREAYCGDCKEYEAPEISPLFADLSLLPPTLIQVGSNEILRSDSEELYNRMKKYRVHSELKIYKGAWHVFQQAPIPKAQSALEDMNEFVRREIWRG